MILFYAFVLFGSQVHHIWAPEKDTVYDILACITFSFCIVDMVFRILVEPDYFKVDIASCRGSMLGHTTTVNDNTSTCSFGSFLFWCDLLSTGMILFDISWINRQHFDMMVVDIKLDENGFPVCTNRSIFDFEVFF